jgi:hypothetical protein
MVCIRTLSSHNVERMYYTLVNDVLISSRQFLWQFLLSRDPAIATTGARVERTMEFNSLAVSRLYHL